MVFFKNKEGTPYQLSSPSDFLTQKSISRRLKQGIALTENDLPVTPAYLQGLREAGAQVFFSTRWMNGALVQCDQSTIPNIQALNYVDHIDLVAPHAVLASNGRKKLNLKTKSSKTAITSGQLQMLGLDAMQAAGYKGEGITIAILDAGFSGVNLTVPFQHLLQENKIDLQVSKDFVYNSNNIFQYDEHGTEVFSVIAAYQDGVYIGGAYQANFQLFVTEEVPTEYRVEEYNWLFAAERADSAGVDIIHSSLGYNDFDEDGLPAGFTFDYAKSDMDGKTAVITKAAEMAAARGIAVVCSAGNEGGNSWKIITAPADGPHVLSVANVGSSGVRASSSSVGPSADGRIKPDVAALGTGTQVIKPNGATGTANGTSLAAPLVTSLLAGVWQRYPQLQVSQLMDAIRNSASQSATPDDLLGYGIPHFVAVVNYLEQIQQTHIFEAFPNPVVDTLTIRPKDPVEISECRIEVVNLQGKTLWSGIANFSWLNRTQQISFQSLAAGLYFVRIQWQDKIFVFRIVKI
jgi:hypothetical protein